MGGCRPHFFGKVLIVGHFLTVQISLQQCGSIVVASLDNGFFCYFFFWGVNFFFPATL